MPEQSTLGFKQLRVTDNLEQLMDVLPPQVRKRLEEQADVEDLLEIVMDLGREPEARFPLRVLQLSDIAIKAEDIQYVVQRVGQFGKDNRAGIERTLHRISAIRNRQGNIVGLTCRIGRAVYGTIDIIRDVVEGGRSILMLGRPGVGKTTKLREVARILSDEFKKRVVIVDTSNEIAGDGDIPHPAIGHARRMQVATPEQQHAVMIEAVENHMPEVIVIDEIGTEQEAFASRTIAERGVMLVATAHGNSLDNLLVNPTLSDLVGGIQTVTLSDEEAKRRGTQKSVLERKAPPTFDVLIEIMEMDKLAIHHDVASIVDKMLRGAPPRPEIRVRNPEGEVEVVQPSDFIERQEVSTSKFEHEHEIVDSNPIPAIVKVFPYGVSRNRLERAIKELRVPGYITKELQDSNAVITLKTHERKDIGLLQEAKRRGVPVYVIKSNTYAQIAGAMRNIFHLGPSNEEEEALRDVEDAVQLLMETGEVQELPPQSSFLRRIQHQLVERYDLASESVGTEPYRRLRIFKP
ncbi:MAG: R3H domain-containing nucleic acid-binding protein [Armatimonadota bacterium]|nr:AAA family ATPase [bacterium]